MKLNFFDRFSKNTQISNLMKLSPVGAWLFHVEGQTFDKSNSCFLQFCECAQYHVTTINFMLFMIFKVTYIFITAVA